MVCILGFFTYVSSFTSSHAWTIVSHAWTIGFGFDWNWVGVKERKRRVKTGARQARTTCNIVWFDWREGKVKEWKRRVKKWRAGRIGNWLERVACRSMQANGQCQWSQQYCTLLNQKHNVNFIPPPPMKSSQSSLLRDYEVAALTSEFSTSCFVVAGWKWAGEQRQMGGQLRINEK